MTGVGTLFDTWRVTIDDLRDLADSRGPDAAAHLDTVYRWRYEQLVARARGIIGFGAGLLTAILVGLVVPSGGAISWPLALLALVISLVVAAVGVVMHSRAARVQREYLVAHGTLADLQHRARS